MQLSFDAPFALFLLLFLPCFVWCRERTEPIYFPKEEWLPKSTMGWDRVLLLTMSIYTLMVIALAQPFLFSSSSNFNKKGRDLVLLLDTSGSMAQRGFSKENSSLSKYEISTSLAKAFINSRHDDNVGLVVFGSFAFTASPLTYDLEALNEMFTLMSDVGVAGTSTAIGDALMQGLRTVGQGEAKSKVLILLTDGVHNAGATSPKEAVEKAKKQGVKIYTIGIGEKEQYDVALLNQIAKDSGAKSFFCQNSSELERVYKEISALEPSPIRSEEYLNKKSLFFYPLLVASLLLVVLILYYEES